LGWICVCRVLYRGSVLAMLRYRPYGMTPEAILIQLGSAVLGGMHRADTVSKATGAEYETTYSTKFMMPDGRWWSMSLALTEKPDGE
jgi:hypothetical protein